MKHLCITHGTMGDKPCPACKPKRIQLSRRKGFKLPPNTVNVARPSRWGNPYKVIGGDAKSAVNAFRSELEWYLSGKGCDPAKTVSARADLEKLRGMDLACWCKLDAPCHADVLLEAANK